MGVEMSALLVIVGLLVAGWLWLLRVLERAAGADWGNRWVNRVDGLLRNFCIKYHRLKGAPMALPESGPAIVVCNHISGIDPLLLIALSPRPLRFIIATEEYERFGLNWLFRAARLIPVDRQGRPERAFRAALEALQAGEVVALFPQGRIYLDREAPRHLKPGATRLAEMTGATIYPYRLEGVAGEGTIFPSIVKRGRVTVTPYAPMQCGHERAKECHQQLERLIYQATAAAQLERPAE